MKIIKNILILLFGLIAVALIVALFVKKEYAVEKEIIIKKPVQEVFAYIKYIKNQDNYSIWAMKDPKMKKEYKGTDGTIGFISAWESTNDEVGVGEQEIVKIEENKRMDMKLRFKVPFEAEDNAYMATEMVDSTTTKVKWGFTGAFPYPMNLMQLFMNMDQMVGKDLSTGLDNLKVLMEK